jgi:hypothetical protein
LGIRCHQASLQVATSIGDVATSSGLSSQELIKRDYGTRMHQLDKCMYTLPNTRRLERIEAQLGVLSQQKHGMLLRSCFGIFFIFSQFI